MHGEAKLILASRSRARADMLRQAGLEFEIAPADIDEEEFLSKDETFENIAKNLAKAKALEISRQHPEALVIGSDQLLVFENKIFSKAKTRAEAKKKLQKLKGKTHQLISAAALTREGEILWCESDSAMLTMKNFDEDFLDHYIERAGDILTSCVGAYAYEQQGAELFEKTEGDYYTILGMPLLPLMKALGKQAGKMP